VPGESANASAIRQPIPTNVFAICFSIVHPFARKSFSPGA
jgi:hypothetical protein